MEDAVVNAMALAGSVVYAFGARFGPEKQKDQYFKFTPGNGMHDIHMNQGNDKKHAGDDGVYQDGCLIFQYPEWQVPRLLHGLPVTEFPHRQQDRSHHPRQSAPAKKAAKKKRK